MPSLIVKSYPEFFSMRPPVPVPDIKDLLLKNFHPADVECAFQATAELVALIANKTYSSAMYEHSPGLKDADWPLYLECSRLRVVKVLHALRKCFCMRGKGSKLIIDYGSYFGNFALAAKLAGYEVIALDFYSNDFAEVIARLREYGVTVMYTDDFTAKDSADALLLMGVIEHIPHTPRRVLKKAVNALKSGGFIMLETPNIAYAYKRKRLLEGLSPLPDLQYQYYAKEPFAGHHREFTTDEVRWMLEQEEIEPMEVDLYNFSYLSNAELTQTVMDDLKEGYADPSKRELIFITGKKRNDVA
jgi:2-polyprenyl-3-methyl-5-hydroxy-6-metoxy-1,4-benzoquinol methylase